MRNRLHRFATLDGSRRALIVEAALRLLAARIALKLVPFPRLARRFGAFAPPTDPRASRGQRPAAPEERRMALNIRWAVARAAVHVPFRATCLPQAIAAHLMLKRRGIDGVMHFGAAKAEGAPVEYHAWLDAAGIEVTGYPVAKGCTAIACFV